MRLAHTTPRMEPKGSVSWIHAARGGTLVSCDEIAEPTEVQPGPSAASIYIAQDWSVGVGNRQLRLRRGQNPRSPRLPAHEAADDSLTLRCKSGSHAAHGRTTVSWDRCPLSARNGIRTAVRLAHTSPRFEPRGSESRTHAARGGTLVSCHRHSGADRSPTRTPVRLAHTSFLWGQFWMVQRGSERVFWGPIF